MATNTMWMGLRRKSGISESAVKEVRLSIKRRKTPMTYSEFISMIAEKSGVREGFVRANLFFDKKPLSEEYFHLFRKQQDLEKGVCFVKNPERFLLEEDSASSDSFVDLNTDDGLEASRV